MEMKLVVHHTQTNAKSHSQLPILFSYDKLINIIYCSDKTVRVWRWNVGTGFEEEVFSPLRGHRYGVTSVRVSPQVNHFKINY